MADNSAAMEVAGNSKRIKIDDNEADVYFGAESLTDLVLEVEEKKFHVSKLVLSLASPVFHKMFESDFKERSCAVLPLPGKSADSMLELLRCIYPDTLSPVTSDNALMILPLVEEYQMLHLKPRCEQALIGSIGDKTSAVKLFQLLNKANDYDLKQMRNKCVDLASNKTKAEIDDARKQVQPPAEDLINILDNISTKLASSAHTVESLVDVIPPLSLCLSEQATPSELYKLAGCLQWTGRPLSIEINIGNGRQSDKSLRLNDMIIDLNITSSFSRLRAGLRIARQGKPRVECFVHTVYIIVNEDGNHHHISDIRPTTIDNRISWLSKDLNSTVNLRDDTKKFVKNNIARVVAFIFVSEPIQTNIKGSS